MPERLDRLHVGYDLGTSGEALILNGTYQRSEIRDREGERTSSILYVKISQSAPRVGRQAFPPLLPPDWGLAPPLHADAEGRDEDEDEEGRVCLLIICRSNRRACVAPLNLFCVGA